MAWSQHIRCALIPALLTLGGVTRADDITLLNNNRSPMPPLTNLTILRIEGQEIVYRTAAGQERKQPIDRVVVIKPSGDIAFGTAEEAFIGKQWDAAVDGYVKSLSAREPWKIRYLVPRLIESAEKVNRFDAALAGYIALAKADAASATSFKPTLPAKGSKFLDDAARDLDTALRTAEAPATRQALLSLLLDVHLARGDQSSAGTTVEQLLKLVGTSGATDPKLAATLGEIRLGQARLALDKKAYTDAMNAIAAAGPQLNDSKHQAEALFIDAQARAGLAELAPPDARNNARLDASLAFMRVVAHFGEADGKPFVGESMLRAGALLEAADRAADARLLYDQLTAELPDTPFAAEAAKRIEKITGPR